MEIERKFLIEKLPDNLKDYPFHIIEQSYLCVSPVLRIRKRDDRYIFTFKSRAPENPGETKICVAKEWEEELTEEAYLHLKEKADGRSVEKKRYIIPYGNYRIELDVFYGEYEGLYLAEVEFPTVEEAKNFVPPEWFGKDVSDDFRYRNNYLATKKEEIGEDG